MRRGCELQSKLLVSPLNKPYNGPLYNPLYNLPLRSLDYSSCRVSHSGDDFGLQWLNVLPALSRQSGMYYIGIMQELYSLTPY